MINFAFKKSSWKLRIVKKMDASYLKNFNKALTNLELNLQEERIRAPFKL